MNLSPTFRANFTPLSSCTSCYDRRFPLLPVASASFGRRTQCGLRDLQAQFVVLRSGKRNFVCRLSETTEADSENDKDKHELDDKEEQTSVESVVESNRAHDSQPTVVDQGKDRSMKSSILSLENMLGNNNKVETTAEDKFEDKDRSMKSSILSLQNMLNSNEAKTAVEDGNEAKTTVVESNDEKTTIIDSNKNFDNEEVTSGSPLPGVKLGDFERIPKETIDILKSEVFGFDTFFVTSQEPYEIGVLFKGNLRGTAASSYEKIAKRLKDKFGDQYKLFLLNNPEDDKPVAVIVPQKILQPETTAVPEWFAAASFATVTLFTLLLRNVPDLQSNLLSAFDNLNLLKDGLPGALVTALILGVHEISHILVAKSCGVKLGVPYFVPSWQIGSFGTITRIVNIVPKREDLLKVAAAGPLAGFSLGLVLLLVGFIVPPSDGVQVVNSSVFHESFLAGGIAKLLLGDALKEGTPIAINPLVIWAWAGLVINAINSIPAGELDGGRISFAIWGRKASARFTGVSIVLLGLSSLINDIAFYWVVLIFFLQRGPIAPLSEEVTDPDNKYITLGVAVLFLGLLVCLPYPFLFSPEALPISSM